VHLTNGRSKSKLHESKPKHRFGENWIREGCAQVTAVFDAGQLPGDAGLDELAVPGDEQTDAVRLHDLSAVVQELLLRALTLPLQLVAALLQPQHHGHLRDDVRVWPARLPPEATRIRVLRQSALLGGLRGQSRHDYDLIRRILGLQRNWSTEHGKWGCK